MLRPTGLGEYLLGYIAIDDQRRDRYIQASGGRRRAGRPARYYVRNGNAGFTVTAYTNEEAIEKANKRLGEA